MRIIFIILFVTICGTASESQLCEFQKSVELTNGTYTGLTFGTNETFLDPVTNVDRGCVCLKGTCARKCCPFGRAFKLDVQKCVDLNYPFDPPVLEQRNLLFTYQPGFNATEEFIFMTGLMNCTKDAGETRIATHPNLKTFNLTMDGNLYVSFTSSVPKFIIYGPDKYCIDTFFWDGVKPRLNAIICYIEKPEDNHYELSSTCMLISCFFILLTVAVYAWLPELRNLHGMVLVAYLLCFFVGFLCLASMQILILRKETTEQICLVLTFIVYFFLLAAFFWLNVMCYDIWWTFSGKRAHAHSGSQNKRFMFYAIYAFSVPTVLTIILASLEFANLSVDHPLLPNIRLQGCFIHGNSKLLYLYGPIVILCVANMTFFSLTAFKIWKIKKETKMLRGKESSTHDQDRKDTQRFTLYVKLFTVMGINWILEVVSSFYPSANFFWQFSDAYNVLVGLIIFIIFVCKKKTWNMIKKRFRQMRGKSLSRMQTTISTTNASYSTSQDELQLNSIRK